ncbi:MAG: 2-octaprenylphenol hydroxylase [Cellvibrionaceae bacterium]|jgi:2-octaprenylphenol hydroxylase
MIKSEYNSEYNIVIVGAGLVGVSLAAKITADPANQHLSIALIDQDSAPSSIDLSLQPPEFDPRVFALTHASIALLKNIGAWSSIVLQRACAYQAMSVWDDEGTGSVVFEAGELDQPELGYIVENKIVLNAVLDVLQAHENVDIIRGQAVESLAYKDNRQNISLSDGSNICAQLLVAADGAHSKVRDLANLQTRSWDYQHKAIVATVKNERSHQFTAWQNFLLTGPLAFLPLDDSSEQYCSIVWSLDCGLADKYMALSDTDFTDVLAKAFEHKLGNVESISKRYSFPLVQSHAVDYIAPQLVLLGDAAHTIHPLAGQGVNLGLLDVEVLSREISRSSTRRLSLCDASILRRYQRQRKKHNLEIMLLMESFKRLFGSRNLAVRWLRNSGLKSIDSMKPIKNWLARQAMGL